MQVWIENWRHDAFHWPSFCFVFFFLNKNWWSIHLGLQIYKNQGMPMHGWRNKKDIQTVRQAERNSNAHRSYRTPSARWKEITLTITYTVENHPNSDKNITFYNYQHNTSTKLFLTDKYNNMYCTCFGTAAIHCTEKKYLPCYQDKIWLTHYNGIEWKTWELLG